MANPTTNYGFVLPTPTDLVTDLPADFDVALQGVDTRLKALQPGTTLGDLAYSSATANTNTRLAVGATGTVLTVAGGVPTWAVPAGGALTWSLLNTGGTALTGATTVTVSGISAKQLMIFVTAASTANTLSTVFVRPNANSTGTNYGVYGIKNETSASYNAALFATIGANFSSTTEFPIGRQGTQNDDFIQGSLFIDSTDSTEWKRIAVTGATLPNSPGAQVQYAYQGLFKSTSAITSILVGSDSGNLDNGSVFIYGAN
jgi:hypothetical protein